MFTGIVEDIGRVLAVDSLPSGRGRRLRISAALLEEMQPLGASLAVDGVCLTLVEWNKGHAAAEVGPETLERSTLGALAVGATVNLERPMRLGDRLGGHLVSGHVDGVGRIGRKHPRAEALDLTVTAEAALLRYVVEKGSITIDGISLTVNRVDGSGFEVSLVPHTQSATTLGRKAEGAAVNLEIDLIGKYVEKLLGGFPPRAGLDLQKLKDHGFVDE